MEKSPKFGSQNISSFVIKKPFLGFADNFFLKKNPFQTIFLITFCNENNFFTTILKKRYRLFYRFYLK